MTVIMKEQTFYLKCGKEYLQFIRDKQNQNRGLQKEAGYNVHHIHPIGLLGNRTDPNNLVKLTLLEHCIAHVLIYRALPGYATAQAVYRIATGRQYEGLSDSERLFLEENYGWSTLIETVSRTSKPYRVRKKIGRARKGWKPSEATRRKMSQSHLGKEPSNKGRVVVNNGKVIRYINPEQQQVFLNDGWYLGPLEFTEERRKHISENSKGHRWTEESKAKKREQMKGTVRLYKEGEPKSIRVPSTVKQQYLDQGWTTVRKGVDRSGAHKRASQTRNQQRKFSKDGIRKWFNPDQFQSALADGWVPVRSL